MNPGWTVSHFTSSGCVCDGTSVMLIAVDTDELQTGQLVFLISGCVCSGASVVVPTAPDTDEIQAGHSAVLYTANSSYSMEPQSEQELHIAFWNVLCQCGSCTRTTCSQNHIRHCLLRGCWNVCVCVCVCVPMLGPGCRAFVGAERAVVPDSNDAAAVPLQAWSNQRGPDPVRCLTPHCCFAKRPCL